VHSLLMLHASLELKWPTRLWHQWDSKNENPTLFDFRFLFFFLIFIIISFH